MLSLTATAFAGHLFDDRMSVEAHCHGCGDYISNSGAEMLTLQDPLGASRRCHKLGFSRRQVTRNTTFDLPSE